MVKVNSSAKAKNNNGVEVGLVIGFDWVAKQK